MNLADVFAQTAERQPGHAAILGPDPNVVLSYATLRETIDAMAERLRSAGVTPGMCVGLHYPSGAQYIILTYALWRCGACVIPIAVELADQEKERICREIGIDAMITTRAGLNIFRPHLQEAVIELNTETLFGLANTKPTRPEGFVPINPAFLRFTSGTTGESKGVVLSHETIYERIHAANDVLHIGPDDRVVWLLSMSYHFAVSIVAYLTFGASIILCKNHFGPTVIRATNDNRGTLIYGSPMHYELMAGVDGIERLPSLRLAISTTTALRNETLESFYQRFGIPLVQAFGIIEIGLPFINLEKPMEKRGSVGKLLPAYELSMQDIGLGERLRAIRIRGKGLFDAYYSPWRTREQVMTDGWFATGDLGELDEEGYLYIRGRSKDMISVAGMKFFPQEVEQILNDHPAVKESCVYAHQHHLFGEVPHARVVTRSSEATTEQQLKQYLMGLLAPYKVPDRIFFVDNLNRTASGKLIRDELRMNNI